MSSRDSLDDQLDVVLAVLVDEWVDFLHRGEKGEGVVALKRAKQDIQEHIDKANENGFYAGCGVAGIELYAVPDLYKKYRTELTKQLKDKGGSE